MSNSLPTVSWEKLQRRKLQVMAESVKHVKDVAGMKIIIHPNVYPPGTDTHLLINTVRIKKGGTALDVGTGTGAVACKLALLGAKKVLGVDLNPRAIANANENKNSLRSYNIKFRLGDMFEGIDEKFDVISINLPYTDKPASNNIDICFYDKGHKKLRVFFSGLSNHLKTDGTAYISWSNISSMNLLPKLAEQNGFNLKLLAQDIGGHGYTFYVYSLVSKRLSEIKK